VAGGGDALLELKRFLRPDALALLLTVVIAACPPSILLLGFMCDETLGLSFLSTPLYGIGEVLFEAVFFPLILGEGSFLSLALTLLWIYLLACAIRSAFRSFEVS